MYPGKGICFVRNDCKVFRFCRSKCHKNFKHKRNPRKSAWTKSFRKARGKEMTVDPVFDFEKRRNAPIKYDRNIVGTTLRAIKRTTEIKRAREERFYANRMKGKKLQEKSEALVELKQDIDLISAPVGLLFSLFSSFLSSWSFFLFSMFSLFSFRSSHTVFSLSNGVVLVHVIANACIYTRFHFLFLIQTKQVTRSKVALNVVDTVKTAATKTKKAASTKTSTKKKSVAMKD